MGKDYKRNISKIGSALFFLLLLVFQTFSVQAQEIADFHVQAAEMLEKDIMRVSVYLTGLTELGGVDAEIHYDPEKVTYISSGLGNSFTDGYGMTNCDEATNTVKCVVMFTGSKTAHGELMYVDFRLNTKEIFQPEFKVTEIVDSSIDIVPIPYTISYQHSDGSWTEERDVSGLQAERSVIEEALAAYGCESDREGRIDTEGNSSAVSEIEKTYAADNYKEQRNDERTEKPGQTNEMEQKTESTIGNTRYIILAVLVLPIVVIGFIFCRRKGKEHG